MTNSGPELLPQDLTLIQGHLKDGDQDVGRQMRLSFQYAAAATLLMGAAFWFDSLWLTVPVWLLFLGWLVVRYQSLKQRSAALSRIFATLDLS